MEREGDAAAAAVVLLEGVVVVNDDDEDVAWLVAVVVCLFGCWVGVWMEGPCCRKAERKEERKKGRCEGIVGEQGGWSPGRRWVEIEYPAGRDVGQSLERVVGGAVVIPDIGSYRINPTTLVGISSCVWFLC